MAQVPVRGILAAAGARETVLWAAPGSRTPGAKGESPPPSTQPPAGARGDAWLGKHGASLGLK